MNGEPTENGGISLSGDAEKRRSDSGRETNELALISLALGIFWLFGFGSLAAIYLGWKALSEISRAGGREGGRAFAWTGIASGVFGLMSTGLIFAVAFA